MDTGEKLDELNLEQDKGMQKHLDSDGIFWGD